MKNKELILVLFLFLSVVGFVNASLVFWKVSGQVNAPCIILKGCDYVLFSDYAKFLGVPLAWWGMSFYFLLFVLTIFYYRFSNSFFWRLLAVLVLVGFLFSLYLLYVQLFKINSLCSYCLVSLLDTSVIFLLTFSTLFRKFPA